MTTLPPKTQEVLVWLRDFQTGHACFPTFREVQRALGFKSVSSAQYHIRRLKAAGLVISDPNKARTLRLVDINPPEWESPVEPAVLGIPICGAIAAGSLVEFFPDHEVTHIPPYKFSPTSRGLDRFALRVRGDSMVEAHILDGDVVVLEKPFDVKEIKNGAIVAARVDRENRATLKRWRRVGDQVFLTPENASYSTIQVEAQNVFVEGIYVGLVRDLV